MRRKLIVRVLLVLLALGLIFYLLKWAARSQAPFELPPEAPVHAPAAGGEESGGETGLGTSPSPEGSGEEPGLVPGPRVELAATPLPLDEPVFAPRPEPDPRGRRDAELAWLRELEQRLDGDDLAQRRDAAERLRDFGEPEALPKMRQLARADADPVVRRLAVAGLGASMDPADLELLRGIEAAAEDDELRTAARLSMYRIRQAIDWGRDVLDLDFALLAPPLPGGQGQLQFEVRVLSQEGYLDLGIDLPDGVTKVSGEDRWSGTASAGFVRRLTLTIRVEAAGEYAMAAGATLRPPEGEDWTRTRRYTLRVGAGLAEWIETSNR